MILLRTQSRLVSTGAGQRSSSVSLFVSAAQVGQRRHSSSNGAQSISRLIATSVPIGYRTVIGVSDGLYIFGVPVRCAVGGFVPPMREVSA